MGEEDFDLRKGNMLHFYINWLCLIDAQLECTYNYVLIELNSPIVSNLREESSDHLLSPHKLLSSIILSSSCTSGWIFN